jgi:chromosome segregation ATPase
LNLLQAKPLSHWITIFLKGIFLNLYSRCKETITIKTSIGNVQANATALNATLTAINGSIATITTNVGQIQVSLNQINAQLTTLSGNVATVKTDIGTLETDLNNIQVKVTSIKGDTANISTALDDLNGTILSHHKNGHRRNQSHTEPAEHQRTEQHRNNFSLVGPRSSHRNRGCDGGRAFAEKTQKKQTYMINAEFQRA